MVHARECFVIQTRNVAEAHPKTVDNADAKMAGKEMDEAVLVGSMCCFEFNYFGRHIRILEVSHRSSALYYYSGLYIHVTYMGEAA